MAKINGKQIGDFPGTMKDYGGGSVPTYYLLCDGSVVSQTTYAVLFAKIGTGFNTGGEGGGNFRLPDSRRKIYAGSGGSATVTLGNTVGSFGGEETHLLSANESGLPSHSHTDSGHTHPPGPNSNGTFIDGGATAGVVQTGAAGSTDTRTGSGSANIQANSPASASSAHNIIQPTLIVTKLIRY